MDTLKTIGEVLGNSAATNILLAACVVELRRVFPWVRALGQHFKLPVATARTRAQTNPGTGVEP